MYELVFYKRMSMCGNIWAGAEAGVGVELEVEVKGEKRNGSRRRIRNKWKCRRRIRSRISSWSRIRIIKIWKRRSTSRNRSMVTNMGTRIQSIDYDDDKKATEMLAEAMLQTKTLFIV